MIQYVMNILKSFVLACIFSSSIYLQYFNISYLWLNSFIGIAAIYLVLKQTKKTLFFVGFFVGILWFWWVYHSFEYYGLSHISYFVVILIGLIYGAVFYIVGISSNIYIKASLFGSLYFVSILGFNWFKPQAIFANSYFDVTFIAFATILLSLSLVIQKRNWYYALLLVFAFDFSSLKINKPTLNIYMPQYNTPQDQKWKKSYKQTLINQNLENINYAINMGYEFIILPETAFPFALNKDEKLLQLLQEKSKTIAIVAGGLELVDDKYYNTSYFFHKQKLKIARKLVLVPFGEAVPLPAMIRDWVNDKFYNGAKDYEVAKKPTTFDISGIKFRNAICYEATTDKIFENLDTRYMVVLSNNAWFVPSIEPALQNMLLKYYARKYDMMIYHSSNSSENTIIKNSF
ncbi:MAG: apolipoprotein N-acyltransferase [Epsilonproteobacteria bacterium]|nr:MAG: apolipoprotein N-acyltransferase [Campylobacterota bacterium]